MKIKRRLKSLNKEYNQSRIDNIQFLRNDLFEEIALRNKSKYFAGSNGMYLDIGDFNSGEMVIDFK
ncbi:hypothetical protein [Aequorivita capsosiphonis]|uniref:hypothetical protein n=1 Tax=Aequorivita capsosiphonis TaxID=487317 RepID=UPI0012FC7ED1|nr:hypothetical protein [Aequorivita capsosiphonis]